MSKLRDQVVGGVFWTLLEKIGVRMVTFVVTLVLARLLTPHDYGTVAILTIFVEISRVLVDCGFSKALVQRREVTQADRNSAFYLNLSFSMVIYAVLFLGAPIVAHFYRMPELISSLRVMAVVVLFEGANGVQEAELNRRMRFDLSCRVSVVNAVTSGITGVLLALAGYGHWALVWSTVAGAGLSTVARWYYVKWRPSATFSLAAVRDLFSFGWKISSANVLTSVYNNLYGLLIGRLYARTELAFIQKGAQFPRLVTDSVDGTLAKVAFPALARLQDDPERLRDAMRKMITTSTFVMMPAMFGCAFLAEPLVRILLGDAWLPAVPFLQVACVGGAIRPFDTVNLQAITACGKSGTLLTLIIIRRAIGLLALALTIRIGVMCFYATNVLAVCGIGVLIDALPNARFLGYGMRMQLRDVLPSVLLSATMVAVLWAVAWIPVDNRVLLAPQVALGLLVYLTLAWALRMRAIGEFAASVRGRVRSGLPARVLDAVISRCGGGS